MLMYPPPAECGCSAVNSCRLVATVPTVVDGTPRHRGALTAQEAPEMIHGVDFDFPGDYELAAAIVERGRSASP